MYLKWADRPHSVLHPRRLVGWAMHHTLIGCLVGGPAMHRDMDIGLCQGFGGAMVIPIIEQGKD